MRAQRTLRSVMWLALGWGCTGDALPPTNSLAWSPDAGSARSVTGGTVVPGATIPCIAMGVLCDGQTPYTCASGRRAYQTACTGERPVCSPGNGCLACLPGALRCDPAHPEAPQRCTPDGGRWESLPACEGTNHCTEGRCGDPCQVADGSRPYLGCDYWATQTPNSQLDPAFPFAVVLGNPQAFEVTVQIRGGALTEPRTETVPPGAVRAITLPWVRGLVQFDPANPGCSDAAPRECRAVPPARSGVVRSGAYQIHATAPVAAYQFNPLTFERSGLSRRYQSYSNDASLLISQRALTQRYLALTMPHWRVPVSEVNTVVLGGFLAVAAVAGETTSVTVRLPRQHGVSDAPEGMVRHDNLMPGDVALIVGDGDGDLSGAVIEASAPVAVFAGHDCTQVPQGRPACDHLEEQLFPLEALGRDYVVAALRDRDYPHVTRVVAAFDNTLLTLDPATLAPPVRLAAGEVFQIITDQSFRVMASRPVEVAQFMVGQGDTREVGGDPAMVLEVPAQQYRARYDFLVPDTYTNNFLDLIVPTGAHVLLDGMPYNGTPRALGPWSIVHGVVGAGAHRLSTQEGVPLGIKVSGTARYTSYMYPGGLDLQLLPPG